MEEVVSDGGGLVGGEIQSILLNKEYSEEVQKKFIELKSILSGSGGDGGKNVSIEFPTIGQYRAVVGENLVEVVLLYNAFNKKILKEQPRKVQRRMDFAMKVHLLTELTYQAFQVGYEWSKSKGVCKDKNVEI